MNNQEMDQQLAKLSLPELFRLRDSLKEITRIIGFSARYFPSLAEVRAELDRRAA